MRVSVDDGMRVSCCVRASGKISSVSSPLHFSKVFVFFFFLCVLCCRKNVQWLHSFQKRLLIIIIPTFLSPPFSFPLCSTLLQAPGLFPFFLPVTFLAAAMPLSNANVHISLPVDDMLSFLSRNN